MKKTKIAIIGMGNIGIDLLLKIERSPFLECSLVTGRSLESSGIALARSKGIAVSDQSIHAIEKNPTCCDIVFDATSAHSHVKHALILKKMNKFTVDLTPAKVGDFCVPVLNLEYCTTVGNVNMVTCGGQAIVPIAKAITDVHPETSYIETVSTIASKSAGIGTRENIDEFTQTTKDALSYFSKAGRTKSIILLNPAEPPIIMRNTIYALIENPNMEKIRESVAKMVLRLQEYVPGYRVILEPTFENGRVTTTVEVLGSGDYLPLYAGNLDIITCAAVRVGEYYAEHKRGLHG